MMPLNLDPGAFPLSVLDAGGEPVLDAAPVWLAPMPERPPVFVAAHSGLFTFATGRVPGETLDAVVDLGPGVMNRYRRVVHECGEYGSTLSSSPVDAPTPESP